MKPRWILPSLTLILAALACNWSDIAPPAAPVIEPTPLPTFAISTLTPIPTETPLPTPTSTPDAPIAWPKDQGVNCRYGPGPEWKVVNVILPEIITEIKGRTVNTAWWYVSDPQNLNGFCWVAYDVVDTAGNLNTVSIVEPPMASVMAESVEAEVAFSACGSLNQVIFTGLLTTNGPVSLTYHWEVNGDAQQTMADETLTLDQAGTQQITSDAFSADCGAYSARLVVTNPNEISVEKAFIIQSP
jgi:hypothetical protein